MEPSYFDREPTEAIVVHVFRVGNVFARVGFAPRGPSQRYEPVAASVWDQDATPPAWRGITADEWFAWYLLREQADAAEERLNGGST